MSAPEDRELDRLLDTQPAPTPPGALSARIIREVPRLPQLPNGGPPAMPAAANDLGSPRAWRCIAGRAAGAVAAVAIGAAVGIACLTDLAPPGPRTAPLAAASQGWSAPTDLAAGEAPAPRPHAALSVTPRAAASLARTDPVQAAAPVAPTTGTAVAPVPVPSAQPTPPANELATADPEPATRAIMGPPDDAGEPGPQAQPSGDIGEARGLGFQSGAGSAPASAPGGAGRPF